jgi:hypothetical protein
MSSGKMPALYIGHGAPMLLDDPIWSGELRQWANVLTKPKAIFITLGTASNSGEKIDSQIDGFWMGLSKRSFAV